MSQRNSEYARQPRDFYATPAWVTQALLPHIPDRCKDIWEPACGRGGMLRVLLTKFIEVVGTDIEMGGCFDFLTYQNPPPSDAIITNPPYNLSEKFICHALRFALERRGIVAMLLRTDYDHAKTRRYIFTDPTFSKKLVLTKRIVWFERTDGKKAAPSENHAWFIWDWEHSGPPTLAYHYDSA